MATATEIVCPSCQARNRVPIAALEYLAKQRAGTLRVIKINVDNESAMSAKLGVQGIPTMVLYNAGTEIARQVGAMPAHSINSWVDSSLRLCSRDSL